MTRRALSQNGQATIPLVAGSILAMLGVALFAQYGGALAARGQDQRTADIAAAAAAGRMAKDYPRTLEPPLLPNGAPNPHYLSPTAYRLRARAAAVRVATVNKAVGRIEATRFGRGPSVTISTLRRHEIAIAGTDESRRVTIRARATAELRFTFTAMPRAMPANGSGGGYNGPLAYRQG
ncbi:MAG: hypothetical protein ACRDKE_09835, partial [Solirubrobacterales bacterium]